MPPKCKFTREQIVQAALEIVREQGFEAVTARSVGARLASSPKVIFSLFCNMEELSAAVLQAAQERYQKYLAAEMASGRYPPYKGSGMGYIRFAKEERQLFRLLFMRDRTREQITDGKEELRPILAMVEQNTGLGEEEAYRFHLEMWLYVHGIATMIATSYLDWDLELVGSMLTDGYQGLKSRYGLGTEMRAGDEAGTNAGDGSKANAGDGAEANAGDRAEASAGDEADSGRKQKTARKTGSGREGKTKNKPEGGA